MRVQRERTNPRKQLNSNQLAKKIKNKENITYIYKNNNKKSYKMTKKITPPKMSKQDKDQSAAILHAIEMASSFQLYSYRIISHAQYIERVKELVQLFNSATK